MNKHPQHQPKANSFEDTEALSLLIDNAFVKAAKAAVAENDRLGIVTHGAVNGVLTQREPTTKRRRQA